MVRSQGAVYLDQREDFVLMVEAHEVILVFEGRNDETLVDRSLCCFQLEILYVKLVDLGFIVGGI